MIEENIYGRLIKEFIWDLTHNFLNKFKEEVKNKLIGIIITGSFAAWLKGKEKHQPSWTSVPDVNYYLLIEGLEEDIPQMEYMLHLSIIETLKNKQSDKFNYNVILDLHPFSISSSKPIFKDGFINIQLTTRVINLSQKDRYPDYSWYGWSTNYIVLYAKDGEDKELLKSYYIKPKRDKIWLRNMYLCLLSYGNILQILPLYTLDKEHLIFETYRYLKEITKDGVALALTNDEFERGELYKIITKWKEKTPELYKERYGKKAAEIVELLINIDENYQEYLKNCQYPVHLIKKGIELRNIVFEKGFKERLKEIDPNNKIFLNLPLWW